MEHHKADHCGGRSGIPATERINRDCTDSTDSDEPNPSRFHSKQQQHDVYEHKKMKESASCCPLVTIGCNENWKFESSLICRHCPFVACCGKIEPLDGSEYTPYCPNPSSAKFISGIGKPMVEEVRCVCGCCISTPICALFYFPCCLLSHFLPRGWINVGPCCWWGCDQYGGKGYDREIWYVDD